MKVLVALCAVVACGMAKPYGGIAYSAPSSYSYSTSVVSVSKPGVAFVPAPAPLAYAAVPAPAPVAYEAPAVAPAPVAYAAAPAVVPAPAPVAYAAAPAVVPAPAPVVPAPAPVAYAAAPAVVPAPAPVVPAPAPVAYAAAPAVVPAPAPVVPAPAPVAYAAAPAIKSQYHAQNEIGEASYGHAEPGQTHNAVQDAHGNKIGSFSYVNPHGEVLRTDYVADGAGYRVASNNLPAAPIVAPIDTPEVAAAKEAFLHEYAAKASETHSRRRRSAVLVQTPASTAPLAPAYVAAPITYTAVAPAVVPAPVAYTAVPYAPAPLAAVPYAPAPAVAYSPVAAHAPVVRPATLTTVVNNPGHAVSYRVD